MKKIACMFLSALLIIPFLACTSTPMPAQSNMSSSSTASLETLSSEVSSKSKNDDKDLKTIFVAYRADTTFDENGNQRMIIDFENTGNKVFSGDISVSFVGDGEILGYDIFPIKDFKPGNKGHGNVYITPYTNPVFTYEISDYSFSDDPTDKSGTEDIQLSKKLTNFMYENFGGCGKKEFAASWYSYIQKIQVYKNATLQYAIVTVSTTDDEIVKDIGNTIFGNAANRIGADGVHLDEVIVKDKSENELFRRSK